MAFRDIVEKISSGVVCIVFFNSSLEVIGKGSGFFSNGHLVTNNHVYKMATRSSKVCLRNTSDSVSDPRQGTLLSQDEFRNSLVTGSDENNCDFALLKIPELESRGLFEFDVITPDLFKIGDEIALLGFPLDHMNLTCHRGFISSFFKSGPADVIQIDASVNSANSGGPLIDPATGQVIGIVTRKGTGLTKVVSQLKQTVESNIRVISQAQEGGLVRIGGIDPLQAISGSQSQVLQLISEIERSANVGIGYAFSTRHILEEAVFADKIKSH